MGSVQGKEAEHLQQNLAAEFAPHLGCDGEALVEAVKSATEQSGSQPLMSKILAPRAETAPAAAPTPAAAQEAPPAMPASPLARLQVGLRDVRQALVEGGKAMEITRTVLEVAHSALELDRSAVFILDANRHVFVARVTLASREPSHLQGAAVSLGGGDDLSQIALTKKLDIYIDNPRDSKTVHHLPAWVRAHSLHPFFLLPMTTSGGTAIGLIFGQQRDDARLTKPELATLGVLRDLLQARLRKGA